MRTARALGGIGALLVATLVGGAMISSTLARSSASSPSTSPSAGTDAPGSNAKYCEAFRSKLAGELNVSESALEAAAKAAAEGTIDEAVKNGDLTKGAADKLKERVANASDRPCFGLGVRDRAFHRGAMSGFAAADLLGAAADALDMQTADLRTALHSGQSLKAVAEAKGVDYTTVSKAVVDAAKADLDKAVDAGKITQQREDQMVDRLQTVLDNGTWPASPRPGGPGRGHGAPGSAVPQS